MMESAVGVEREMGRGSARDSSKVIYLSGDSDSNCPFKGSSRRLKTTGLEPADYAAAQEMESVGVKREMSYGHHRGMNKGDDIKPVASKKRLNNTVQWNGSNEGSQRVKKWNEQRSAGVKLYKETKFNGLRAGTTYSWLNNAKHHVHEYDNKKKADGFSRCAFDESCAAYSCCWTSSRIEEVRDLVEAFETRNNAKKGGRKRHAAAARPSLSRHSTVRDNSKRRAIVYDRKPASSSRRHDIRKRSGNSGDTDFFQGAIKLSGRERCNHIGNKHLYEEFMQLANYRIGIGYARKEKGHYQTGKSWSYVGNRIRNVSYVLC